MTDLNSQQTATAQTNADVNSPNTAINIENSGSLDTLAVGDTLLVDIRRVKDDSEGNPQFQCHFAERIQKGMQISSVLSRANRFNPSFQARAQRKYQLWHPLAIKEDFGIDVIARLGEFVAENVNGKTVQVLPVNILNPVFANDLKRPRIQINETNIPTDADRRRAQELGSWDRLENVKKIPNSETGVAEVVTSGGNLIFVNRTIVDQEPVHIWLEMDNRAPSKPIVKGAPVMNTAQAVTEQQVTVQ